MTASSPTPPAVAVMALHCSGSSGRQWEPLRALLPGNVVLHAPDLIASGSGEIWPAGATVTLDAETRRLAPWLQAHPRGVHLLGHSYGGAVALQLALRWPQRVRSLTLFEPVRFALLHTDADRALWRDITAVGHEICAHARAGRLQASAERFVDYWSGEGTWARMPGPRQSALAPRMTKVSAEFDALFGDGLPPAAYARLALPVRVLAGTRSPAPARRVAEVLAGLCPDATLRRLEGLGHMGPLEAPQRVVEELLRHLELRESPSFAATREGMLHVV